MIITSLRYLHMQLRLIRHTAVLIPRRGVCVSMWEGGVDVRCCWLTLSWGEKYVCGSVQTRPGTVSIQPGSQPASQPAPRVVRFSGTNRFHHHHHQPKHYYAAPHKTSTHLHWTTHLFATVHCALLYHTTLHHKPHLTTPQTTPHYKPHHTTIHTTPSYVLNRICVI